MTVESPALTVAGPAGVRATVAGLGSTVFDWQAVKPTEVVSKRASTVWKVFMIASRFRIFIV